MWNTNSKGSPHPGVCVSLELPGIPLPIVLSNASAPNLWRCTRYRECGLRVGNIFPRITLGFTKLNAVPGMDTLSSTRCVISQYREKKKDTHTAAFHKNGECAIVEMMRPCEKVNHSLAITVLDANLLLLRLWVSLIRSPVPCWDLLQHQDVLVVFFKSDCIRLHVLQIQITPHTDAAVFLDNEKNFKCFRNSFGTCDANCCVYKLSHFQSQGLEWSEMRFEASGFKTRLPQIQKISWGERSRVVLRETFGRGWYSRERSQCTFSL